MSRKRPARRGPSTGPCRASTAGPIHFAHTAAFRLFGVDLVSLRYSLVAAAFGQAMFALALVGRRDVVLGAAAGIAAVALGVVQFVDPMPELGRA